MRIEEIMNRAVITSGADEPLHNAARKMWDHDCGAVMVTDRDGKLVGMVTDRDICMAAYTKGLPLHEIRIHEVMASHVHAVRREQSIADVEEVMATHQVRRVPVVDSSGKPIGVVSLNDLARDAARPSSKLDGGAPRLVQTVASIGLPHDRVRRQPAA